MNASVLSWGIKPTVTILIPSLLLLMSTSNCVNHKWLPTHHKAQYLNVYLPY